MKEELLYYVNHSTAVLFRIREEDYKCLQTGQADIVAKVGRYSYAVLNLKF